jgi:hypothetical protein
VEEEGLAEDLDLDLDCPPPFMQRRREAVACRAPSQAVSTERLRLVSAIQPKIF